ncbi:MAG: glycosyltransferase family 4 protein [Nitrospirae bacterium]|nr:MAG: glycosyltransferase family 4 protein [Nitrospirota bacterium]
MGIPTEVYSEQELTSWTIFQSLCTFIREWHPDVVHTHRYKENILGGIAAKLDKTPLIVQTVHGIEERLSGWARARMFTYSLFNQAITRFIADGIVGVSQEITSLLRLQYPKSTTVCIHNGIDTSSVRSSQSVGAKRKEFQISESTLVVEYLLSAVSLCLKDTDKLDLRLVIVGDGPSRAALEGLAIQLGIAQYTLFLGARNDVYDLINMFDIFVLPSLHEGIPMALLEAMALERAIVASRVGGIPEVIDNMIEGKLAPAQDVQALKEAILELARSPNLRARLGRSARERVTRDCNVTVTASATRQFYWFSLTCN